MLIGMPGCGKSSIGLALSRISGLLFFDTDDMVTKLAGISIEGIFCSYGEAAFRRLERQAVAQAAESYNSVIATGGGAVLREENCRELRHSGRFYFIERSLKHLPTTGRPLSVDLAALYRERLPIYQRLAHAVIINDGSIEQAAKNVLRAHQELENKKNSGG